jgi:pyruvate/2-oxoacid:ferredoxin oxidoreductase alpha subunit
MTMEEAMNTPGPTNGTRSQKMACQTRFAWHAQHHSCGVHGRASEWGFGRKRANRIKMVDKRPQIRNARKTLSDSDGAVLHGPAEADLTLVGWGSMKGPIIEAMTTANENGKN